MAKRVVDYTLFEEVLQEVITAGRYAEMKKYISHSDITVYQHCSTSSNSV